MHTILVNSMTAEREYPSIFQALLQEFPDTLPIIRFTKATLVHISHTLEDVVLTNELPALIFTGFQQSSHWQEATERYRRLVHVAHQVCIFAGDLPPGDSPVQPLQISLAKGDPLRQEWFLAILTEQFSVVVAGLDNMETVREQQRTFQTIWSFDPQIVSSVMDVVESVSQSYRPDVAAKIRLARQEFRIKAADPAVLADIMIDLMSYEDRLNSEFASLSDTLQDQKTLYQSLVNHSQMALIAVDSHGMVTYADGNRLTDLTPQQHDIVGHSLFGLMDDADRFGRLFEAALAGQTNEPEQLHTPNGSVFMIQAVPRYDLDEVVIGALIIALDQTSEYKILAAQAEHERLTLELEAERDLGLLRDRLMTTISHEFRTPLASIQTSSDLLLTHREKMSPDDFDKRLNNIHRQVNKLSAMLDDISLAIHQASGYFKLELTNDDLGDFAQQVAKETAQTLHQGPRLGVTGSQTLADAWYDERLVEQIVRNLVGNALKYSSETVSVILSRPNPTTASIRVEDRGIGISEQELDDIYTAFFRGHNVGTISGTGMGLTIVQNAVQQHGGSVAIDSELGQYTHVQVLLDIGGVVAQ